MRDVRVQRWARTGAAVLAALALVLMIPAASIPIGISDWVEIAKDTKFLLGLGAQTLTPALARELGVHEPWGVIVRSVRDGSPAAKAGVRPGDVITEVNRQKVTSVDEMLHALDGRPEGIPDLLRVRRNGRSLYVVMTL